VFNVRIEGDTDANLFYTDATNSRIGIGTITPTTKLDVAGASGTLARFKSTGNYGTVVADNDSTTGGGAFACYKQGAQIGLFGVSGGILGDTSADIAIFAETGSSLKFYTNGSATVKAVLNTSGGLQTINTIGVGNATPSTSGAGITFPATQSASSDANTLDDYEEGTWTPNQGAGLTVVGAFSSAGTYTKIGNIVTAIGRVVGATTVACVAGGVVTGNLPFTNGGFLTFGGIMNLDQSSSGVSFVGGGSVNLTSVPTMGATQFIFFSVTYQV
jgi:hypothetical protein